MARDADVAQQLLERLLADPAYRADFRRDPVGAARRAGLADVAEDMLDAGVDPLQTLELRESRSSLAGVLMAAALEGVGIYELTAGADPAEAASAHPLAQGHADPAAYGMEGSGGGPSAETLALLHNRNVVFDADGIADLQAGRIDARIVSLLDTLSRDHKLTISAMRSDHPKFTTGGSVSNHFEGRAVDIATVDGRPVNPGNAIAKRIAVQLASLDPRIRPTEIGSPWPLAGPAYFSDAAHQNHLHVGYDDPIEPGWQPPGGGAAAPQPQPQVPAPAEPSRAAAVLAPDDLDDPDDSDDTDDADGGDDDDGDVREDGGSGDTEAEADDEDDESDDDEDDDEDDDGDEHEDEDDSDEDEDEPDEDEPDEEEPDEDEDDDESDEDALEPLESPAAGDPSSADPSSADPSTADPSSADPSSGAWQDPGIAIDEYPGDDAPHEQIAAWMAGEARRRGVPAELPVMAGLVESGLQNLDGGDADSVGFFQMRTSIWNRDDYAGYPDRVDRQLDWFLDQAVAVKAQRIARGLPVDDPKHYGDWIADIERPAAQFRGRYQLRLDEARELLERAGQSPGQGGSAARVVRLQTISPEAARRAREGG